MSEILGVLFAILIGTMVIPKFAEYQRLNNENIRASATAQQQKQLIEAGTAYIKQNATAIQAAATATSPVIITVPMLQAPTVRLLDASFSADNPYAQTWQIQVLEPTAGNLQAFAMSTGGTALPDSQASKIASLVGAQGGFIPKNDSGIYPGGASTAYGSFGGWATSTANYALATGGHPAALISFNNGQLVSNYLYRNAVPGQPQLNQMNTALDMSSNNINNVGTVSTGKVQVNDVVTEGSSVGCTTNGLVAKDSTGLILSCQSGVWTRSVKVSGDTMTGRLYTNHNDWALTAYGAGFSPNAAPQSGVGSAYVNDIYIRSVGMWASQMVSDYQFYSGACYGSYCTTNPGCPGGYTQITNLYTGDAGNYNYFTSVCKR